MRLRVTLLAVGLMAAGPGAVAQTGSMPVEEELRARFSFEGGAENGAPRGWGGGPPGTIFLDETHVHSGKGAARIERSADSPSNFSPITFGLPAEFSGTTLELKAYLRSEAVEGVAALWLREDGESGIVAFDNMLDRQLRGTNPWAPFSIRLPLKAEARKILFGAFLAGTGKVWLDDVELLVDGKPVWQAPRTVPAPTILGLDREFDAGSKVVVAGLTAGQVDSLATLGLVWGFLKYHHPAATLGRLHWDYELLRVLPRVLSARDRTAALAVLDEWVAGLGPVPPCSPCAGLDAGTAHLRPDLEWIAEAKRLGPGLSARLRSIHAGRSARGEQFYVSFVPGVGNPAFERELPYPNAPAADPGFQLLALFRFWNIVQYFSPYRDVIGEPWEDVLRRFVPRVALARTRDSYQLELMALIASVHDTHANLWSSLAVRPPVGDCQAPVTVRSVEGSLLIAGTRSDAEGESGLKVGDVILGMDGVPVRKWIERWRPFYAASNEPTRMRDMARQFTRGNCGAMTLRVRRGARTVGVTSSRVRGVQAEGLTHDVPGDAFRRLSDKIAYLKLSSVKATEAARYVESAAGTAGLVVDIRNYPAEFVVFALGALFVDVPTPFARFTLGDAVNPGSFRWGEPVKLEPSEPHYGGKVVILVDEVSQSSAEYTSMAFRASPRAIVIGSTTAGADGNVSAIPLPGGLRTMISGIGVFYPDKRPTQRVGIIPDVEVRPTIAGIRAGRDEVLEEAIRRILGAATPRGEVEALVKAAYGRER